MPHHHITFFLLLAVLVTGCSNKIKVHGTVVFDDDRSPLTVGTVLFQNDTFTAKGELDAGGRFQICSVTKNDGVPPGVYQVSINGAVKFPERPSQDAFVAPLDRATNRSSVSSAPIPLIKTKYMDAKTSGITFDTSKDNVLHIVVERP